MKTPISFTEAEKYVTNLAGEALQIALIRVLAGDETELEFVRKA